MKTITRAFRGTLFAALLLPLFFGSACQQGEAPPARAEADHGAEPPVMTNRVAIPPLVRQNLGITFAKVERRVVRDALRVPGSFETLPSARREYRAPAGGRLDIFVQQYATVQPGDILARIQSPQWRQLRQEMIEAQRAFALFPRQLEVNREHAAALRESIDYWVGRVEELERLNRAGGGRANDLAEARSELKTARSQLAEANESHLALLRENLKLFDPRDADLTGDASNLRNERFDTALFEASSLLGIDRARLLEEVPAEGGRFLPRWRTIEALEIRAEASGVLEKVEQSSGAWVETADLLLATVDPKALRFRAIGLQSDLGRLRDGQQAFIVPPTGGSLDLQDALPGSLTLGLEADSEHRAIDLIVRPDRLASWARPGVAAHAEIVLEGGEEELAMPLACIVRDGLEDVFFRRDPADPDKVIRAAADLGASDGRWVEVMSGVREGDEIVLDGAYELRLASSQSGQDLKGGHFHADGTWHVGEH
jgi:multidrug efflux pump subunit AcrA (membrane-fusion protein)